ncbi:uncharacterized protein LOC141649237 [Silene latifolia]|uniref:uncharacterized protein LOC141649237 n=1 Tax=Silene latifolia TaxID=37657 RepID=UPI003D7844CA
MSTAFHPAINGQTERTIKTLEDMLRACAMEFGGSWEDRLDLIEFSYSNSYHASIGMTLFEALYGRKCRSPVCWDDSAEAVVLGPQMVKYLPPSLDRVHNIFHVSQLRKYVSDPSHVLEVENIELDEALTYIEVPKEILDSKVRKTRNGETFLLKMLWSNHNVEEATWEPKEAMRERYPHLFEKKLEHYLVGFAGKCRNLIYASEEQVFTTLNLAESIFAKLDIQHFIPPY